MTAWDVQLAAHAKINLGLRILGKRPDGFHAIETVFQEVGFHDTLLLRQHAGDWTFTTTHPDLPTDARNLVVRAARLFQQETGRGARVAVHLEKRIPLGAGLGGGSSDAAATLRGLDRLCHTQLPQERLADMGARLGADVAFFLYGGTAVASGRGEVVRPICLADPRWVVIVHPGIHISSAWAYKNVNLKLTKSQAVNSVLSKFEAGHIAAIQKALPENALEAPVIREYPVIQDIKAALQAHGAEWALMSGSGSSVFGLFLQRQAAEDARRSLERPGWYVVVTHTYQRTT